MSKKALVCGGPEMLKWLNDDSQALATEALQSYTIHDLSDADVYRGEVTKEATQGVDLVVMTLGMLWGEGAEQFSTSASIDDMDDDIDEKVRKNIVNFLQAVVASNRNAEVFVLTDSTLHKQHQKRELLRIVLLRHFDVQS